ncbi:unnamed protein product [Adineta steineri]|uniref:Transmembrane protein n=1 Tax=Adineta steineri TaxID=433720 RepID=A0A814MDG2_9BILA|nr:unnamed protein product [Adineta steineri]
MIQQTISISCEFIQMEYKAKFISKSNDYTSIENQRLIHWFYQKFIQMNIAFPWSLIGQQLDEFNNLSFFVQKCEQNLPLWSINDFIHLALLENQSFNIEDFYFNQYQLNYTKSEHYFGHCRILYELHENFIHLFCHSFVKKLLHYLITAIITTISHFVLYLITILLRRFIQNHQNQFDRLKSFIRPSTVVTTDHSVMFPLNQNEYENLSTIVK